MPLSINTNVMSLNAQRAFFNSNAALETAFERLSTGNRVNSAVDDAAGLAIGKDLQSRVSGLNQAIRNVNDGISMVQITEGVLDETTTILQRMRDLAVQASNGSLDSTERGYLDTELNKLSTALDDAIDIAKFNDTDLVSSSATTTVTLQSGSDSGDTTAISIEKMSAAVLDVVDARVDLTATSATAEVAKIDTTGITFVNKAMSLTIDNKTYTTADLGGSGTATTAAQELQTLLDADDSGTTVGNNAGTLTVTWATGGNHIGDYSLTDGTTTVTGVADGTSSSTAGIDNASSAITTIDRALAAVASDRANLGATQAQLESTVRNLANVAENTSAAAGRIMDTDYAAETANLTKAQILQQAATSVLAQANAQPQSVLALLR
ncbi:flagellin [Luminiphilus sp.]|nr:flagellin [Luminiphilus sp.]